MIRVWRCSFIITLCVIAPMMKAQTPGCEPLPPTILIGYHGQRSGCTPTSGACLANEPIDFTATLVGREISDCDAFFWSFGDGTGTSGRTPWHFYQQWPRRYLVELRVSNPHGEGTTTIEIPIQGRFCDSPPRPIQITYRGQISGCSPGGSACAPGETILFSVPSGPFTCWRYSWTFGDGTPASTAAFPLHGYAGGQTYRVVLRLSNDNDQRFASVDVRVAVATQTPGPTETVIIYDFSASPASVTAGQKVVLRWDTANTTRVEINPLGLVFPGRPKGTHEFVPVRTGTYTLTAYGRAAFTARAITVTVTEPKKRRAARP